MANNDDHIAWRVPQLRADDEESTQREGSEMPPPLPRRRVQTPQHGQSAVQDESTSDLVLEALRDPRGDSMSSRNDAPPTSALVAAARTDEHGEVERARGTVDLRLHAATAVLSADAVLKAGSAVALGELESFAICGEKQVLFCRVSRRGFFVGLSEGAENPEVTFDALLRETESR